MESGNFLLTTLLATLPKMFDAQYLRFEVLTAVTIKITFFLGFDTAACQISVLKTGVAGSSKTVMIYQTTRHHIPEGSDLHGHCYDNLKSHISTPIIHVRKTTE
jgi:hypothetical protein